MLSVIYAESRDEANRQSVAEPSVATARVVAPARNRRAVKNVYKLVSVARVVWAAERLPGPRFPLT